MLGSGVAPGQTPPPAGLLRDGAATVMLPLQFEPGRPLLAPSKS